MAIVNTIHRWMPLLVEEAKEKALGGKRKRLEIWERNVGKDVASRRHSEIAELNTREGIGKVWRDARPKLDTQSRYALASSKGMARKKVSLPKLKFMDDDSH